MSTGNSGTRSKASVILRSRRVSIASMTSSFRCMTLLPQHCITPHQGLAPAQWVEVLSVVSKARKRAALRARLLADCSEHSLEELQEVQHLTLLTVQVSLGNHC